MIPGISETIQWVGGAIIIVMSFWKSAGYIRSQINPINDSRIKKILSNVQGQQNQLLLPSLPSPQYASFPVNTERELHRPTTPLRAVEIDIPHSILRRTGKRTPTAVIELQTRNSSGYSHPAPGSKANTSRTTSPTVITTSPFDSTSQNSGTIRTYYHQKAVPQKSRT